MFGPYVLFSQLHNFSQYLADTVFSVAVVGTCVVLVWRGFWNVLEDLILPDNETKSCVICLGKYLFFLLNIVLIFGDICDFVNIWYSNQVVCIANALRMLVK